MAKPKAAVAAIHVPFTELRATMGKPLEDAAVEAVLAKSGKVSRGKPDGGSRYVVAKQAGYDLLLQRPSAAKRGTPMVVTTLFLYSGARDHRAFIDLPFELGFVPRRELLARMGTPSQCWLIGEGEVPPDSPKVSHDEWVCDGLQVSTHYRDDDPELVVRHVQISTD
jgi:hypothetical protein